MCLFCEGVCVIRKERKEKQRRKKKEKGSWKEEKKNKKERRKEEEQEGKKKEEEQRKKKRSSKNLDCELCPCLPQRLCHWSIKLQHELLCKVWCDTLCLDKLINAVLQSHSNSTLPEMNIRIRHYLIWFLLSWVLKQVGIKWRSFLLCVQVKVVLWLERVFSIIGSKKERRKEKWKSWIEKMNWKDESAMIVIIKVMLMTMIMVMKWKSVGFRLRRTLPRIKNVVL